MRRTRGVVSRTLILPIEPITILDNGVPIYPIMGSEDDDSQDESDSEDDEEEEEQDDEEEPEDKGKPKKSVRKPKETPEQFKRRLNREAKEHREAREAAEKKLREIEDKDKTELEIAKRDLEELKAKYEKDVGSNADLRIENAFLKLRGYDWHDPDDVLDAVRKDVAILDDGTVDGLEEAVRAIAKKKPYLLKPKDEEDGEDQERQQRQKRQRGSSGDSVNGPKSVRGNQKAQRQKTLMEKYKLDRLGK